MDSLQIACFMAVAQTNSFSRAAALLYKSQSVVSRQVISLESELGVRLFVRTPRSVTLTAAGKMYHSKMEKLVSEYQSLVDTVRAIDHGYVGELRIHVHAGYLYAETMLRIVQGFEKAYPDVRVLLNSAQSAQVHSLLSDMQTDIVYARWADYSSYKDFEGCIVTAVSDGVLIPHDHPLADRYDPPLSLIDFRNDTFIVLPDDVAPGQARRLEHRCWEHGFDPKKIYAPNSNTAMLWLEAKRGISITNREHVFTRNSAFRFVELPDLNDTEGAVIWNKNNENHSVSLFKDFVASGTY
ncbi:MAG: LysR family transcriptional regulator [Oscillospiraceae bacterium]|nr:LysR family transcriptional regulator [Oscillospiraceae bacterium]